MIEPYVIVSNPMRENLDCRIYRFTTAATQLSACLHAILEQKGSGIIYASTRRQVDELTKMLGDAGVAVMPYHAGLTPELRRRALEHFSSGQRAVMVATNAFGMGIDKADIRFVFHFGAPSSLEAYLQEIGRAGRDGGPAVCRLFFTGRDLHVQRFMLEKSFPKMSQMSAAIAKAQSCLSQQAVYPESGLIRVLQSVSSGTDAADLLNVMVREGIVLKRDGDVFFTSDATIVDAFLDQYEQRRRGQEQKLKVFERYLQNPERREQSLRSYFDIE
jgi:ATP-dependent DNA helicase RecQ